MDSELTEQYLNQLYDNIMKEHLRLLNELKNQNNEMEKSKEKDNLAQINIVSRLMPLILKLRNIKRDIKNKINS
jgi:hypothetical protein